MSYSQVETNPFKGLHIKNRRTFGRICRELANKTEKVSYGTKTYFLQLAPQ
jgi:hypothetical protein